MRFRISAKYIGNTIIDEPLTVQCGIYTIGALMGEEGYISEIYIEREIEVQESYLPKFDFNRNGPHKLNVPNNPYQDDMIDILQYLESFGGFWFGVDKIFWEDPKLEWIPKDNDEKKKLGLYSIQKSIDRNHNKIRLKPVTIENLMNGRAANVEMIIPMSFLREGHVEHKNLRYINAFYNFYYFLEDQYGKGKTKNKNVMDLFIKSQHIRKAVTELIQEFNQPSYKRHKSQLLFFPSLENKSYDIEGIIELIVMMRGNLHHFSQKSTKVKGHPLNQRDFETLSFAMMMICYKVYPSILKDGMPK